MKNKGKICSYKGCVKPARVKLLCVVHYNKVFHPDLQKIYRQRNKKKIAEYRKRKEYKSIKYMHQSRFGGLREQIMQRDGYQCANCGLTRSEHYDKYGRDLTLDHINGEGRYSLKPDNTEQNLQVLCLPCHGKKDCVRRVWRPVFNIKKPL